MSLFNITTQQIEAFLTIAKHLKLSTAAEAMYSSQPALSMVLQRLEERIGFKLFTRTNKGLQLTESGAFLFRALTPLYNNLDTALLQAKDIAKRNTRHIRIAGVSAMILSDIFDEISDFIHSFEDEHPQISVTQTIGEYTDIRDSLEYGSADIIIAFDYLLGGMKNVSYKRVCELPMFLSMSANHPLAAFDKLPASEKLSNETFGRVNYLSLDESHRIYKAECDKLGFSPKDFVFLPNVLTLFHFIGNMKGMSICIDFNRFAGDSIKQYLISDYPRKMYVVVAWQTANLSPESRLFISELPGEEMFVNSSVDQEFN